MRAAPEIACALCPIHWTQMRVTTGQSRPQIRLSAFLGAVLVVVIGGCASDRGSHPMEITSKQYAKAFDAACTVSTKAGMPPLVKDRAGGVIEGRPRLSGSLIQPWRVDNADFSQFVENTINKQRRRVRFEFLPIDFRPPEPTGETELLGSVVPGSTIDEARSIDLLGHSGDIEVRVWVYVEREFIPNLQRGTWSRVGRAFARNPLEADPRNDGTTRTPGRWSSVGRDEQMEQRLLAQMESTLGPEPASK